MKKQLLSVILVIVSAASTYAGIYQIGLNSTNLGTGTLNGSLEVPANGSTATGIEVGAGLSYDSGLMVMNINLAYGLFGANPLTGAYTAAHIHQGAVGVNGPVVVALPGHFAFTPTSGFFSGTVPMTVALETALFNNDLYVNIHSTLFPGGEIRAQLIPATIPEPGALALIGIGLGMLAMRRRV